MYKLPTVGRHLQDNGATMEYYENYYRFILLFAYNWVYLAKILLNDV